MTDPDFPEALRFFIREHIPDVDAAELLLLLAGNPERSYTVATLLGELLPSVMPESTMRKHLALFEERGLIAAVAGGEYQYRPVSPQMDDLVRALTKVYNERPVTMVRMIYALKDEKIRSFADAFRFKK